MKHNKGSAKSRSRGRVVMLVDNGVDGDSRVQKSARSAAEAGWDVVLLGILGRATRDSWRIGDAKVQLIRTPQRLAHVAQVKRSLRRPLAYPPGRIGPFRLQATKARRTDLAVRWAALEAQRKAGGSRARELAGKLWLVAPRAAAKFAGRWAKFRAGEQSRMRKAQQDPASRVTRLSIAFWRTLKRDRSWRRLDPGLWDYELAFGKEIDKLRPDLIHAHDFRMIGVGVRATIRARAEGRKVQMVYDAHEFVPGVSVRPTDPRWLPAQIAYERDHIRYADAVLAISAALADLLQETHRLPERPTVVLNAPSRTLDPEEQTRPVPDLRALCGVGADTPLIAYSGGINPVRGVDLAVDALPSLPGVHLALVSVHPSGKTKPAEEIEERAAALGVADRVHLLPYVPHWMVPRFLAPADAAFSGLTHLLNHEIALSNKFFEYTQARLPLIVSDVRTMAETVRETGQGEVFRAGDVDDFVRAAKAVLADPGRYRAAYDKPGLLDQWSWEAQAEVLDEVYSRLLPGRPRPKPKPAETPASAAEASDLPARASA